MVNFGIILSTLSKLVLRFYTQFEDLICSRINREIGFGLVESLVETFEFGTSRDQNLKASTVTELSLLPCENSPFFLSVSTGL